MRGWLVRHAFSDRHYERGFEASIASSLDISSQGWRLPGAVRGVLNDGTEAVPTQLLGKDINVSGAGLRFGEAWKEKKSEEDDTWIWKARLYQVVGALQSRLPCCVSRMLPASAAPSGRQKFGAPPQPIIIASTQSPDLACVSMAAARRRTGRL
eukprot:scaffold7234_cov335-Prasinococcus_capsulatus_cf.AAC.11